MPHKNTLETRGRKKSENPKLPTSFRLTQGSRDLIRTESSLLGLSQGEFIQSLLDLYTQEVTEC